MNGRLTDQVSCIQDAPEKYTSILNNLEIDFIVICGVSLKQ